MVAPIIPMVTDRYLEQIIERAAAAGAKGAGYTILRLPYELKDLFREWLDLQRARARRARHEPDPPDARRPRQRSRVSARACAAKASSPS